MGKDYDGVGESILDIGRGKPKSLTDMDQDLYQSSRFALTRTAIESGFIVFGIIKLTEAANQIRLGKIKKAASTGIWGLGALFISQVPSMYEVFQDVKRDQEDHYRKSIYKEKQS